MNTIPITQTGYDRLKAELEKLKSVDRKEVIEAIKEARAHGDLSENAEYDAAKERQGIIEARISELEAKIPMLEIIDISKLKGERVIFGATVEMENVDNGERRVFTIVGPDESDISTGKVSVLSPMAKAVIGKKAGDDAVVQAPGGEIEYEILKVFFA
ncbi:MAG: transcription elongation factor GreA [Deferribacteraceae bacterium]|jgi:transcription elongation factor GreA|nr:transcription elongation factor GreA [Deferribacteraceae bacterium]